MMAGTVRLGQLVRVGNEICKVVYIRQKGRRIVTTQWREGRKTMQGLDVFFAEEITEDERMEYEGSFKGKRRRGE